MRLPISRQAETTCLLCGSRWGLSLTVVFATFAGAKSGDISAVHASLRTVASGVTAAGVDEDSLAASRLADPEPVNADVGEPYGQAHHGTSRVFVRYRTALGVVHVPGL